MAYKDQIKCSDCGTSMYWVSEMAGLKALYCDACYDARFVNPVVVPDFWLAAAEETEFYSDVVAMTGRVASIWLVDRSRDYYLCELTSSKEGWLLRYEYEKSISEEMEQRLWEELVLGTSPLVYFRDSALTYFNRCSNLSEREWLELIEEHDGDKEAARDDLREVIHDNENSNWTHFDFKFGEGR